MNGWKIFVIVWYSMSLGVYLVNHGKPRTGNYHFGYAVISVAIIFFALYKGGFFS